ncbi:MAG: 3'-5' exonuclease [Victivallaceae bacterium]|nr:3'-5' exonuclease [Victivallaceae bacterium]MDD4181579.1 3'-5' exonuclease [Victivallaceae bacterium]
MPELNLERPIIFFDLETTGTNILRDRIVEISVIKIFPDGQRETHTRLVNPGIPISEGSIAIHGITDADVANEPQFNEIAPKLLLYFEGCDVAGYNVIKFDIPLLINEFMRVGIEFKLEGRKIIDAYNIFCKLYPRTLSAAYEFFCGKTLGADAHSAEADTKATIDVLFGQIAKHPEIGNTAQALHELSDNTDPDSIDADGRFKWSGSEVIVSFSKHSGTKLRDLAISEPGFLKWIIKSDFSDDVKKIAHDALSGIFPKKPSDV